MLTDLELSQAAGEVLQEAVTELLAMPHLSELGNLPEEELERDMDEGYAPEIRENARVILLARRALGMTSGTLQNKKD